MAGRDCGRRSRRGATDVIRTRGGVDVGDRRAVRRPAYIADVTRDSSSWFDERARDSSRAG